MTTSEIGRSLTPQNGNTGSSQSHEQERIVSKLDEIVTDQWRDPSDYLEPLTGVPHSKLRIGAFRLGCKAVQTDRVPWVYTIEKRPGAYKPGDD